MKRSFYNYWACLVVVFAYYVSGCCASHFRGAVITWKPGATQTQIIVDYRISWRRSFSSNFYCDSRTIQSGAQIGGGEGQLQCLSNCRGMYGGLPYQCTDFHAREDWSSGRGNQTITFPGSHSLYYEIGFEGNAWISLNAYGGGQWLLRVKADLNNRKDTGKINSSPTVEIAPIIRLQYGCSHTISLPVYDADGDVIRCRWAQSSLDECGSVCLSFPGADINGELCIITYEANHRSGWYAAAVQVEDFMDVNSTSPLSSVPVQFLVQVYQSTESCDVHSQFVAPTPLDHACIGVPRDTIFQTDIVARVAYENKSISDIKTTSPIGMTKSAILKISPTDWKINVSWSPQNYEVVNNVFCFTAVEANTESESERRCITMLAGVDPPNFIQDSQSPKGLMYPYYKHWSIKIDKTFTRSASQSKIRVYNSKGTLEEKLDASDPQKVTLDLTARQLLFTTTTNFIEQQQYYILFDFGIIKGTSYCGAGSAPVTDTNFWRVTIRDVTPPLLTLKKSISNTNATAHLEWTTNEPATSSCILKYLSDIRTEVVQSCNGSWTGTQLIEGSYELSIVPTDMSNNTGSVTRVRWTVDTTPPNIHLTRTPAEVSNQKQVLFQWGYITFEKGSTICRLQEVNGTTSAQWTPCIWSISYKLNATDSGRKFVFEVQATDSVGNVGNVTEYTWTADFSAPNITALCSGGDSISIQCTHNRQPEALCNVTANDNIDKNPPIEFKDEPANFCGFIRTWTSSDGAGNFATKRQEIHMVVDKPIEILNAPGSINVACGALNKDNMTEILAGMFEIRHPCNLSVHYSISDDQSTDMCGVTIHRTWTFSDNCNTHNASIIQNIRVTHVQNPLSPVNGQTGTSLDITLRWAPSGQAQLYNVFVWEYGLSRPAFPKRKTSFTYSTLTGLKPATKYLWQLVFLVEKNEIYLGPIWGFETRKFIDLVVSDMETPPVGFSGNSYQVKWTVQNIGSISTQQSYWYDAVFLSWTDSFANSVLQSTVLQRNVIQTNDGYSSVASIQLREGQIGNVYVFVWTNYRDYLDEMNRTNNILRSSSAIHVQLTPPPDLVVSSISVPTTTFSGQSITIRWIVVNNGEGIANGGWTDAVWLSSDKVKDNNDVELTTYSRPEYMQPNENYTVSTYVKIPEFISGDFYILVETDVYKQVFEYTNDVNNLANSQPIHVILTPPPDLKLASLSVTETLTTGDTLYVTWNVTNVGDKVPISQQYWIDHVVMVSTTRHWSQSISYQSHYGVLPPQKYYTTSISYYISQYIQTDSYSIIVVTNYDKRLFEFNANDNNELKRKVQITRAVPNLKVQNLTVNTYLENTSTVIQAHWIVENIGHARTVSDNWIDSLYARSKGLYSYNDIVLKRSTITKLGGLEDNAYYKRNETVVLPQQIYGFINIIVNIDDMYSSTGDTDLSNNFKISPVIHVPLQAADLAVMLNVSISENAIGGNPLLVNYTVINRGIRVKTGSQWTDTVKIVGNRNCFYELNGLTTTHIIEENIEANGTYSVTTAFDIPDEMAGSYFICIVVNQRNDIFEGPNTDNNKIEQEININSAPTADLSVDYIRGNISGEVGKDKLLEVKWTVTNIGNSMRKPKTGCDRIGFSRDGDITSFITLNSYKTEYFLEASGRYTQNSKVVIPASITGDIYVCVFADATSVIRELNSKQNNFVCDVSALSIRKPSKAKLSMHIENISPVIQGEAFPGSDLVISYSVDNIGELPTLESSWIDSIYVTDFQPTSFRDVKEKGFNLADIIHIGVLEAKHQYETIETVTLPNKLSGGVQFFALINNSLSSTDDDLFSNNVLNLTNPDSIYSSLFGNFTFQLLDKLPNFQISSNTSLGDLKGGQPITIEYEILNNGQAATMQYWYDAIYLSDDYLLDVFDAKLKSVMQSSKIGVNETLTNNISVTLPLDLETKGYHLILVCDSRNDITEENEDDNELRIVFHMQLRASTDIMVTQVMSPTSAVYSGPLKVEWDIINNGSMLAEGYKCDTAYLSVDTYWDISDAQIGKPQCSHFSLLPNDTGSSQHAMSQSQTPLITSMSYNTIVKTRSNLIDMNSENNIGVAKNKIKVIIDELKMAIPLKSNITLSGFLALHIVDVPLDRTLIVSVTSGFDKSLNRVFVKAGNPATLYDFDFLSDNPNQGNHSITIPSTVNQNYYILIASTDTGFSINTQELAVIAKVAQFEIIDVFPKSIITDAEVTFKITGTLFDSDVQANLKSDSAEIYVAKSTHVFTTTEAYATFFIPKYTNCSKFMLTLGSNSINITASFPDKISIKNGTKGYLTSYISKPGALLFGEKGYVFINLANAGDSDIFVPLALITATGDGEIKLIDESKDQLFAQDYFVIGSSSNGPAGILPPKSYSVIQLETREKTHTLQRRVHMGLSVAFLQPNKETQNPFLKQKDVLKPSHYDDRSWDSIWNNFIEMVGSDSYSFISKMSTVLTEMSVAGRRVANVDDVIQYLLDVADTPYGVKNLVMEADIIHETDATVGLTIVRYLSSRIGSRRQPGKMGNGWILPLWDSEIKNVDTYSLTVTLDKQDYIFILVDDNTFIHKQIGIIKHEHDYILRRFKDNKEYIFDAQTFQLKSVVSLVDDSRLDMVYTNRTLTDIKHSNGPYVHVSYDANNMIAAMEVKNISGPTETSKSFYEYGLERQMLEKAVVDGRETKYIYNYDYSVKYVINEDQSMFIFEYSNMGHMTARRYVVNHQEAFGLEYTYNHNAMVTVTTTPNKVQQNITFDESGSTILVKRPAYLPSKSVTTKTRETSFEGDSILLRRSYIDDGKHIQLADGNGDQVDAYFNEFGQLIQFIDGGGNAYYLSINKNGSLGHVLFPDGTNKTFTYSQNGHFVTTQNGVTKKFEYNTKQQLVMRDIGNNAVSSFEYNENGSMRKVLNEHSKIEFTYGNEQPTIVSFNGEKVKYTYNAIGLVASISTDRGYFVRYIYDDIGNMQKVLDGNNNVSLLTAEYNKRGKISKKTLGNNASVDYEYDSVSGLLTQITNKYPNGSVASFFKYVYSKRHRRISMTTHEGIWRFDYDAAGQLVYMRSPGGTVTKYTYDNRKNRNTVSVNGVENVAVVNNMNQYTKYGDTEYQYDKNGNLIKKKNGTSLETYEFDEDNQLTGYSSNGQTCALSYDALGNLYIKQCNGTKTSYIADLFGIHGANVIEQSVEIGINEERVHFYHGGEQIGLIAMHSGNEMQYFMFDPVGGNLPHLLAAGYGALEEGYNYYLDHRDGSFTWGGAAGALAHGAVDGALSSVKQFAAIANAVKGGVKYAYDHRNGGFTWEGEATAVGRGLWDGFVGSSKLSPFKKALLGDIADVAQSYIEHRMDNDQYTFKDGLNDFTDGILDRAADMINDALSDGIPILKNELDHVLDDIKKAVKQEIEAVVDWIRSHDPNDLIGPPGYGAARFVSKDTTLTYKIRFENDENATAPAQRVYVEHKYSNYLDPQSFVLGEFVFGNLTTATPQSSKYVQMSINMTAEMGLYVNVVAGIDLAKRMVFWEFQSLDPETGEAPTDPTVGFLPPNNGSTGQGYVTFSIKPREDVPHLATIHTNASIYFDENEPIDTPDVFNTIDDSIPTSAISVVEETRTADSVTLSLNSSDSGSGVRHVDLFLEQESEYTLFRTGVTETIVVMPLEPGSTYSVVAIAVDYVGNRELLEQIAQESILKIEYIGITDECDCSSHGNCSIGSRICVCDDGYYGTQCNTTERPIEPPVLELRTSSGVASDDIQLYISARNLSGPVENMTISITGFPEETFFSKGTMTTNNTLVLLSDEFGNINMTTPDTFSGNVTLHIGATQTSQTRSISRYAAMVIRVYPDISEVSIEVVGCFREVDNKTVVDFNMTVSFDNTSDSVPYTLTLKVPVWASIDTGTFTGDGVYTIKDATAQPRVDLHGHFEPIYGTVSLALERPSSRIGAAVFEKKYDISEFCSGDCNEHMYGINCENSCVCNPTHTTHCSKFDGSCTCMHGWTGITCNDDVDECKQNASLCIDDEMRRCFNTPGSFSCVCLDGYIDINSTCTECDEFIYGFNCSLNCPCVKDHADSCSNVNGSCTCNDEWEGGLCDIDVNECALNKTICVENVHTDCQNKDGGFDCPCLVGYYLANETCIENPAVETTPASADRQTSEKKTNVEIHIDIDIPSTDNINTAVTYEKYQQEATVMLSSYYRSIMGIGFIRVDIISLRIGSLIIDHNVVTRNTGYVSQELAVAIHELTKDTDLQFFGNNITIKEVMVEHTKVNVNENNTETNLCKSFSAISPCRERSSCVLVGNIPTCSVTPTEDGSEVSSQTVLALAISLSASVVLLLIVIVILVVLQRKHKKRGESKLGRNESDDTRHSVRDAKQNPALNKSAASNDSTSRRSSEYAGIETDKRRRHSGRNASRSSRQWYHNEAYDQRDEQHDDAVSSASQSNWVYRQPADFSFAHRAQTRSKPNEYSDYPIQEPQHDEENY